MKTKKSIISFENITIRYPDQTKFAGISLDIMPGESWLLTGENSGLGNALLNAMAGKVTVISGAVHYPFYKDYLRENTLRDFLFSPHNLFAFVSSRHAFKNLSNTTQFYYQQRFNSSDSEDSITVNALISSVRPVGSHPSWKYDEVVKELHLEALLDEHLIKLSNGETKRVLIAAALLKNPVLLLLDNPFAGLDVESRREINVLISKIASTGTSIVMSGSIKEIPSAVTHVVLCNTDNKISIVEKDKLDIKKDYFSVDNTVDLYQVKSLLEAQPQSVYGNIVLMKNVCIRYDGKLILDNVNWTIKQGERWALVGPNGSGKSTLLSLINGDNPQAFANDIILFDRRKGSGESIWDIKRKIGFFSPELYQYFPVDTTCWQAVECGFYDTIGLFRPSHTTTSSIALRWMKLLGIDHLANKLLKYVTADNQRLCLLARALVKSPTLLILDEPLQGIDEQQQKHFKTLIDAICSVSNVTMIYVSHYENEIPSGVTKVLRLMNGRRMDVDERASK